MMLWLLAVLLVLLALGVLGYPLLRGGGAGTRGAAYDVAVYRDQLAEIDHNREQGLIGEAEAEAARTEIGRRLLAADKRRQAAQGGGDARRWPIRLALASVALSMAGAIGVYTQVGAPTREAVPFAERNVPKTRGAIVAARQGNAPMNAEPGAAAQAAGMPDVNEAEKRLAARLEEQPEDVRGWLMLGRTRMQQQKYAGAQKAFAKAHELRPDNPRIGAAYAEAIVMAGGGMVTPKAQELFKAANAANPGRAQPNYYLALAAFQQGDAKAALDRWKRMVADANPDAPWLSIVKQHMAAAERQLDMTPGTSFAQVAPDAPAEATSGSGDTLGGPTREQMQAAQDMSPEARQKMIRGMVERLSKRLAENPDNLQGWQRLARSYNVLGDPAKARDALKKAVKLDSENVALLAQYARAIRKAAGQKQTPESLAVSRRILKLDGQHPEALWFVATHEAQTGNTDKARQLFDKALAVLPESEQTDALRRRARELVEDG